MVLYMSIALMCTFVFTVIVLQLEWHEVELKSISYVTWFFRSFVVGITLALLWPITLTILTILYIYFYIVQETEN